MSEQDRMDAANDFDAELAAVERFISDVQQGNVPTGEAMRAYRDTHRPAIERLRAQLNEFEELLAETVLEGGGATTQMVGIDDEGGPSSSSA
jgi:exonuclease VII small subunit